jgi:predicted acylesterase/phospholipase RssA
VNDVFLGVIAVATLAIAIAQIGVMVAAGRLARRLERLTERLEQEIRPLFSHLDAIGRDVSRASALAAAQVERADQVFSDVAVRIELALNAIQATLSVPAREGRALFSAVRAAFEAVREMRRNERRRQGRGDDEDALFI